MQIRVLMVGKLREKYLLEGVRDYLSRLTPYCSIGVFDVADTPVPPKAGVSRERMAMEDEGRALIGRLKRDEYVIALDASGVSMSSEEFSGFLSDLGLSGASKVAFIIGGHLGLSAEVRRRADTLLSLSKLTLPHQMVPLVLLEQVYRAMKICRGEPYHR